MKKIHTSLLNFIKNRENRGFLIWLTCLIIYVTVFNITFVSGSSMYPTLNDKDVLLMQKISPKIDRLKRGDIITFEAPIDKGYYKEVADNEVVAEYNKYNFLFYRFLPSNTHF